MEECLRCKDLERQLAAQVELADNALFSARDFERENGKLRQSNVSLKQQLSTLREAARKLAESVREEGGSLAVVGAKEFRALSSKLYDQTEQDNE